MNRYYTSVGVLLALFAFRMSPAVAKEPADHHSGPGSSTTRSEDQHANHRGQGGDAMVQKNDAKNATLHAGPGQPIHSAPNFSGPSGVKSQAGPNPSLARSRGVERTARRPNYDAEHRPDFTGGVEGRDAWRYRWHDGRWWFWTPRNAWAWYGDDRWVDYGQPYVVQMPIDQGPIRIVNPAQSGMTLHYELNGVGYDIAPGYSQELRADRPWVIAFGRGDDNGQAQYGLQPGQYTFTHTDHGWELYHSDFR